MLSSDHVRPQTALRARYKNRCKKCNTLIHLGNFIAWDKQQRAYVHRSCAAALRPVVAAAAANARTDNATAPAGMRAKAPPGLRAKSLASYRKEWHRYCDWVESRLSAVPGRDVPWDVDVLYNYMLMRSETCAPSTLTSCFTQLAHFGVDFGFILPNSKHDGGDPVLRKGVQRIKKQLNIDYADKAAQRGETITVHHCTALGNGAVSLILSTLQVRSESAFNQLSRVDRFNVAISPLMHTAGMRFGHFLYRSYSVHSFVRGRGGSFHLVTDWSRFQEGTKFCLQFPAAPRYQCQRYVVAGVRGAPNVTVTAAEVMRWHFARLHRDGEASVFAPVRGERPKYEDRKQWLRATLRAALPTSEVAALALVDDVSPHSFRSGAASDLLREGVSIQMIASICRWHAVKAIRLYAERPTLSMSRSTNGFRVRPRSG